MRELRFPKYKIRYSKDITEDIVLMILGGRAPSVPWLRYLDFYSRVWCVDSGVGVCREAQIRPERLIGDRDSALPLDWNWAEENGVQVSRFDTEKDQTDFQLALQMLAEDTTQKDKGLVLTGAFGGRFDHMWSTLLSFIHCGGCTPFGIADEMEGLFLVRPGQRLTTTFYELPHAISIIPFANSTKVTLGGARWELDNVSLEYAKPYTISNRVEVGKPVRISIGSGLVGFYAEWPPSRF
ncbi:thiamine diphosphokinase [Synergistaceae bacterium OttesenSCG-928-D05]|nr:thiamine diphosphokinase [Synergistaceae bacterium OttesenSCG-928-D05]